MKKLQEELVAHRRYLHENAEVGFALDKTCAYVKKCLQAYGYKPKKCGKAGWIATVGKGKRTFLLRADMDGLNVQERTGLPYACKCGNMHACGHDMHTAMLLGAAKLLKEREKELQGVVVLLFQPAEELLEGAKDVIEGGALENPTPQAGMMLHVMTDSPLPTGTAVVASGVSAPACDYFSIRIQGKGCHGAAPWAGIDALTVAARILLALEELSAREIPLTQAAVLTVGKLESSGADNVISDEAVLKGTLRAFDDGMRKKLKNRMGEIAKNIAKAFHAHAEIVYGGGCPTLINDEGMSVFTEDILRETLGQDKVISAKDMGETARRNNGGSEDFSYISHKIPSVMVALAAGEKKRGYAYPLHHPKATFDEGALSVGAVIYASVALEWLQKSEK